MLALNGRGALLAQTQSVIDTVIVQLLRTCLRSPRAAAVLLPSSEGLTSIAASVLPFWVTKSSCLSATPSAWPVALQYLGPPINNSKKDTKHAVLALYMRKTRIFIEINMHP